MNQIERLDAAETAFLYRQLEYIIPQTYDVKYPNLRSRELIPVDNQAGEGADVITYYQYDMVGMAAVITNATTAVPRADVSAKKFSSNVETLASSYGYTRQDIRAAKMAGIPLEQRKANAAKRAILTLENQYAFSGLAELQIQGLLTNSNVNSYVIPNGTSASPLWSSKTPDEMVADMHGVANMCVEKMLQAGIPPDTLLLPLTQFHLAATKRMSGYNDTTVLKYFLESSPYIKNVYGVNELKGAGAGGTDVMVAYPKDPEVLQMRIPLDFTQGDVEVRGLEYIINCEERFGGVTIYYPLSVTIGAGI